MLDNSRTQDLSDDKEGMYLRHYNPFRAMLPNVSNYMLK